MAGLLNCRTIPREGGRRKIRTSVHEARANRSATIAVDRLTIGGDRVALMPSPTFKFLHEATSLTLAESTVGPAVASLLMLGLLFAVPIGLYFGVRAIGNRAYQGDSLIGWARLVSLPYLRYFQRFSVEGRSIVPKTVGPNGLIVVANHCAGLDPVSLQSVMRHPIRFLMSAEMMVPEMVWVWRRMRVIPVCFDGRDAIALKGAIAHITSGGTLGIFPEGTIERPERQLRPFSPGLRLILSRTQAPVLVIALDPGLSADTAYAALFKPTRGKLRVLALIEPGPDGHARDTAQQIFELLKRETGWPVNEASSDAVDPSTVERNLKTLAEYG